MNIEKQIHQLLILTLVHFVCMCICQPAGHMEVWWTNPQKTPVFVTEDTYSEELFLIYIHIYTHTVTAPTKNARPLNSSSCRLSLVHSREGSLQVYIYHSHIHSTKRKRQGLFVDRVLMTASLQSQSTSFSTPESKNIWRRKRKNTKYHQCSPLTTPAPFVHREALRRPGWRSIESYRQGGEPFPDKSSVRENNLKKVKQSTTIRPCQ